MLLRCRVNHQALFPGTAFFEVATAAATALCSSAEPDLVPCLTDATISAPKLLHAKSNAPHAADPESVLECEVDWEQGGAATRISMLTIRSASKGTVHLRCGLAMLQAPESRQHSTSAVACLVRPKAALPKHMAADCPGSQRAILAAVAQPEDCGGVGGRSGFGVHPATADASLHLGAVASTGAGLLAEAAPRPSRVPVALGAYTASLGDAGTGMSADG